MYPYTIDRTEINSFTQHQTCSSADYSGSSHVPPSRRLVSASLPSSHPRAKPPKRQQGPLTSYSNLKTSTGSHTQQQALSQQSPLSPAYSAMSFLHRMLSFCLFFLGSIFFLCLGLSHQPSPNPHRNSQVLMVSPIFKDVCVLIVHI